MKSLILVFFFMLFLTCVVSENITCCSPGYYIRTVITDVSYACWEPTANITEKFALDCENVALIRQTQYNISVNDAGQLEMRLKTNPKLSVTTINSFCFGKQRKRKRNKTVVEDPAVAACYEKRKEVIIDRKINAYCMIVSVVFLALTALVYAAMPELRDLQGKSIVNLCVSLALGLGYFAYMELVSFTDMNLCAARGFLAYFFLIAAFFWMNAISIQIFWGMSRPVGSQFGWKEFIRYAAYAWGCPVVLTAGMAIVNFVEGDHTRPGIGHNTCWFYDSTQQWIYMYSIMVIIIVVNLGIFVYVSATMWRQSFSSHNINAIRYRFGLMLRLFIVMGLPWIFEMVSSLAPAHIVWAIVDIFNMLVGLFIFLLLVVFRRRTIKALHRHGWLCCCSGFAERYLARADDIEDNMVQHTAVPLDTVVD